MADIPQTLDWVQKRIDCSVAKMFKELRRSIGTDVDKINDAKKTAVFAIDDDSPGLFSVFTEGDKGRSAIFFVHENDSIVVKNARGGCILKASLTLDEEGKCCFDVEGKKLYCWQLRRQVLESLFFGASYA